MYLQYSYRTYALLLLFILNAGCVTTEENLHTSGTWSEAQSSKEKSVVFGRIRWIENGAEKKIGNSIFDFYVRPGLLHLEDKSRHFGVLGEDGNFAWSLKPGKYVMFRMNYRDTWSGNYFFVPKVAFLVPDKGHTYYAGTLRAEFAPKRDFIGGLSGKVRINIEDDRATAYPTIVKNLGISVEDIEPSLMVHDPRLPKTIDTTTEFNTVIRLLNIILQGQ